MNIRMNKENFVKLEETVNRYLKSGNEDYVNDFNHMVKVFEEYGLVLIVTIIASGMILFATEFRTTMQDTIEQQWDKMTVEVPE